ncbi:hypothetical protein [Nocardioides marmorisolisilvae]|uniref:Secreted protein n=1 Tax=Nocardioides marmorisolisilvae TaxID=1542737 RepID=A0A3N0DHZ4_9ACTN|nr:hypothetical protein [Nocardioides marmorisolisilvae]RNL75314.1 hypothetical protein EFL95_17970 [Nocardioides marmorisolisilvae]
MTLSRTLAAAGAAVLISTALAGCGSSDKSSDDKSGDAKTLTKTEFQTQANKLCDQANKDTETYGANITEKSSDSDVADAIDKTVKRNDELVDAIAALKAPKDIQDDVTSMLDAVRAADQELDKVSSVKDMMSFDPNATVFKTANEKAAALGLDTCAS